MTGETTVVGLLLGAITVLATVVALFWRKLNEVYAEHRVQLAQLDKEHQAELDKLAAELRAVERERLKAAEDSRTWALTLQEKVIDALGKVSDVAKALRKTKGDE